MKSKHSSSGLRRLLQAALASATALLVGACGGGGDVAGVGTGGTGSFSVGTITGFGSVYVNGVRYEDNGAKVFDDDGNQKVIGIDDNPLRLGMVVEVTGTVDDSGSVRTATQFSYGAELKGPVTAVDATAGTFTVFGIGVRTTSTTLFAGVGGVATLAAGNVVEVHGHPDAAGRIVATLVEREAGTVAEFIAGGGEYRLRGAVEGLSGSNPAYTFAVRGLQVRTDAATRFDGLPSAGAPVALRLNPALQSDGRYRVERLKLRRSGYEVSGTAEGEVEGYVTDFNAGTGTLRVAGYAVRLAPGVAYEDGFAADLKNGVRVEAKGRVEAGVLVAARVEFKSLDSDGDGKDEDVSGEPEDLTFKGLATCVSCAATSGSFTVQGIRLDYDAATQFEDGLSGPALNGRTVEVKSVAVAGASGSVYRATRIKLDD
jgi:hypothetical protein